MTPVSGALRAPGSSSCRTGARADRSVWPPASTARRACDRCACRAGVVRRVPAAPSVAGCALGMDPGSPPTARGPSRRIRLEDLALLVSRRFSRRRRRSSCSSLVSPPTLTAIESVCLTQLRNVAAGTRAGLPHPRPGNSHAVGRWRIRSRPTCARGRRLRLARRAWRRWRRRTRRRACRFRRRSARGCRRRGRRARAYCSTMPRTRRDRSLRTATSGRRRPSVAETR